MTEAIVEDVAIALWHRFAPDYELDWEDESHKAEYRDAAKAIVLMCKKWYT